MTFNGDLFIYILSLPFVKIKGTSYSWPSPSILVTKHQGRCCVPLGAVITRGWAEVDWSKMLLKVATDGYYSLLSAVTGAG